jgi:plastocyanin
VVRTPSGRSGGRQRGAMALALGAVLASMLALVGVLPGHAGTVVRGRVHLPQHAEVTKADGKIVRERLDARDAVIYVTVAQGENASKLGGRARRADVEIESDRFSPRVVPVVVGSKVRFRNRDRVYHTIFSVSPAGRFDLGNLAPGKKRETRLESPGVINLFCQLHPAAAGFVVVCPNWYFARAEASGEFRLPELPRGSYVVHVWHPRFGATQRSVAATGRDPVILDLRL